MTDGRTPGQDPTSRRRHLPAALVVLAAAGALLVTFDLAGGARHEDPPAARPLPHGALAAEHATVEKRPRRRKARPRLVNVVDREAPRPTAIRIPAIGVRAAVIPLGLNPDGTMQTPTGFSEAGWYKPWREPGERGAAVITGHVDSVNGPAVFYRLRDLRRGNIIRMGRADGSVVRFRVEGLERWPKTAFPTRRVFRPTRLAALRLVTCSGSFDQSIGHYVDNTIVYAVRARRAIAR